MKDAPEKYIQAMLTELIKNNRCYTVPLTDKYYSFSELVEVLPLLELIVRIEITSDGDTNHYATSNVFWLSGNAQGQLDLYNDVLLAVAYGQNNYFASGILGDVIYRYTNGDAYGIRKPVPREQEEEINFNRLMVACSLFGCRYEDQSYRTNPNLVRAFCGASAYKLIFCCDRNVSVDYARNWQKYEEILETPINFIEFRILDNTTYTFPDDLDIIYMSQEYKDTVNSMRKTLYEHRRKLGSRSDEIVSLIEAAYKANNSIMLDEMWNELNDLWECPEGCNEENKASQAQKLESYLSKLAPDVRDYCEERADLPF